MLRFAYRIRGKYKPDPERIINSKNMNAIKLKVGQRYSYSKTDVDKGTIKVNMEYIGLTSQGYPGFLIWSKLNPKKQMACFDQEWCERNLKIN